jgi:predicted histone-like DNA-binding protein
MSKGAQPGDTRFYGQVLKTESISLEDLCGEISLMSTASAGDVKNILASLNELLEMHLRLGQAVLLGELGHFRMTAGSHGALKVEDFDTSLFKSAHVRFFPGRRLRALQTNVGYEKAQPVQEVISKN